MKIVIAGGTGAIGVPLVKRLLAGGHHVTAIVRSATAAAVVDDLGAASVMADVLDREGLLQALTSLHGEVVIHQLTALKKAPLRVKDMAATNDLRIRGTRHLLDAAHEMGARRFVTQSIALGYGFGDLGTAPLTENAPFGQVHHDQFDPVMTALASTENQVFADPDIAGISLRYGLFYGRDLPTIERMLRRRSLPITSSVGTLPLVHHDDAAAATVAAVERGEADTAYNIVDDTPVSWGDYITAAAVATAAPRPIRVPGGLLKAVAPYGGGLATDVSMVVSAERAHQQLSWQPTYHSYLDGLRASASHRAS